MNLLTYIQLDDDIQPKPPVKAAKKPAKKQLFEPAYVPIFSEDIVDSKSVKQLRSQLTVDNLDIASAGFKTMEGIIKHNLTVAMLKELESHIKIERMQDSFQDGFSVYGQTMFIGKLDVVE
jgi:hypothetical protein